jgi:hypothetical protein
MIRYWVGADFAESPDETAISVVERERDRSHNNVMLYLRSMFTIPPPVDYDDVCRRLVETLWFLEPYKPVRKGLPEHERVVGLAYDARGVGRGIRPILERALRAERELRPGPRVELWGVQTTAGSSVSVSHPFINVPKRDVVFSTYRALRNETLVLGANHPYRQITRLREQLINYQLKMTQSGSDTYEPWKATQKDDMVDALNLAVWAHSYQEEDL